ncbi:MAG: pirin family protein [Dehalococcoidia bacterium]
MRGIRRVKKAYKSRPTLEGAGVHLRRALGFDQTNLLDPFLLLDDFHSNNPRDYIRGFPWHPHRGIETITYMLNGKVEHGDSMGNSGVISPGDVQWMTAGSGIIHQEMPKGQEDGLMWGFQLWANLPASHKMMAPRYRGITAEQIPEVTTSGGARVKIICGKVDKVTGPVKDIITSPEYLDVTVPPQSDFKRSIDGQHTAFAYIIDGAGYFDDRRDPYHYEVVSDRYFDFEGDAMFGPEYMVMFGDGDELAVSTGDKPVRFLLISGKPLREPVAWYGPIVMNTEEELRTAFEEYRLGTFIKKPA